MIPAKAVTIVVFPLEDGVTAVIPDSLHLCHPSHSHPGIRSTGSAQQDIILVKEVEGGTGPVAVVAAIYVDFRCSDDT